MQRSYNQRARVVAFHAPSISLTEAQRFVLILAICFLLVCGLIALNATDWWGVLWRGWLHTPPGGGGGGSF